MTQAASFSDKTNPMNPLIPRNLRRQMDGVNSGSSLPNPLTPVSFLPDSVRLPAEIEASYLNLLALNSHILSPFARQFLLGNRNLPNLHLKRPLVPPPPPQAINFSSQSTAPAIPPTSAASSSCSSLPRLHEIEETGELVYSIVEGEKVMGFNVWGEVRLCLPHLLRFVLNDVDIDEIGQAISKLRISCTKCSPRQLAMLHGCSALPNEVTSCGLIRKSDAERMLKFLRSSRQRPTLADACPSAAPADGRPIPLDQTDGRKTMEERETILGTFIDVRHDCFGTQRGRVYPHLYSSAASPCIVCCTCNRLFSPQDFVGHTHSVNESDSCCHWGFDSTNWRSYLQLDIDSLGRQKKVKRENESGEEEKEEENFDVRTYRALRDFKVKFLKPLHLPNEITKMVPGPEGRKHDVRKHQPPELFSNEAQPLDCSTNKPPSTPSSSTTTITDAPRPPPEEQDETLDDTRLEIRLRPDLKIRRLWAPHQGRLRIPNPPKLITNCPRGPKPRNLSSDPPVLLDPSCIVTKDSAQLYGRDFIPNVCLKPVVTPNSTGPSGQPQLHLSRSLPSVPSNEDIVASAVEKRLSEAALFPDLKSAGGHRSRPVLRGSGIPLSADFNLFQHSNQGLNSIDSSPARARHSSSAHEAAVLSLSNPLDLHKRCATEEVFRCPSVDSAQALPFRGQLSRTTSDPEINISTVRSGVKRERTGSWSLTPNSSSISPSRRKRLLEMTATAKDDNVHTLKSVENRRQLTSEESSLQPSQQQQQQPPQQQQQRQQQPQNWFSTDTLSNPTTSEMLVNLATDTSPRIPSIVAHWTSTLERIDQFCNSIIPTDESAKRRFDIERQKLMLDLGVLRAKNLVDLSVLMKDNKKLWRLLTDALLLTGSSPTLTPNTLAPPCGVIPGVTDVDQLNRMINFLQGFKPKATVSENFRQSASMEVTEYQSNERSRQHWPVSSAIYRSSTPEMLLATSPSARTSGLATATNGAGSPPLTGDFLLPSKRQRLFRHSYSANSNLNP